MPSGLNTPDSWSIIVSLRPFNITAYCKTQYSRIYNYLTYFFELYLIETMAIYENILIKYKSKLATLVEGDPKAPFSIATTPRCSGGRNSILWLAPLYPLSVPDNAEC